MWPRGLIRDRFMWLRDDIFQTVIASTPLFSIDLIVRDAEGRILLGKRTNRPAKDFWFVPGGRVLKNEKLDAAFERLTSSELGVVLPRRHARLLNLYQHFYKDCVFGEKPDTHYVVAGYVLELNDASALRLPETQHSEFTWWTPQEMLHAPKVHQNTRDYLADLVPLPSQGL